MSSTSKEIGNFRAVKQAQQSLEFAAVIGGGVELEGKSASIKSSSECIQSSNASSFSSCFSRISLAGSRRQLSIRKKERKGDSDEPDAPLLLERELAVGEGDVVIGRKKRDQANDSANNGFHNCFAVEPKPPPGQRHIQITRDPFHVKQPAPIPAATSLVRTYHIAPWRLRPCPPPPRLRFPPCSPADCVNFGGAVVRRLLTDSEALVFNLDKCGYASDLTSIEQVLAELGDRASTPEGNSRLQLLQVDLCDADATAEAVRQADPDLVMHLAAESHVDRSIEGPGADGSTSSPDCVRITSNVNGTFHLLQAVRAHWQQLPAERQVAFRFHHISTDEVFGSLGASQHPQQGPLFSGSGGGGYEARFSAPGCGGCP